MKPFQLMLLLVLSMGLPTACASHKTAVALDHIESIIQTQPDSALTALRSIDTTALSTQALKAHYSLLYAMALDKNWIDTTDVGVVMPAVTYYSRHKPLDRRAKAYYYLGRIQENAGNNTQAILSFMHSSKDAETSKDERFKILIVASVARLYSKSFDYAEALVWDKMAYASSEEIKDPYFINSARKRLALDYQNLEKYQQADSIYRILVYNDNSHVYHQLLPDIYSNYALLCVSMKEFEQACHFYKKALAIQPKLPLNNHWGAYAYALTHVGKTDLADVIFKQLKDKEKDNFSYLIWKSREEETLANFPEAYSLLKQALPIQETRLRKAMGQTVLRAQRDYFEEEALRKDKENKLIHIIGWLIGFILLIGVSFLINVFFKRYQRIREKEYSLLETTRALALERDSVQQEREQLFGSYAQFVQQHYKGLGELFKTTVNTTDENITIKQTLLYEKVRQEWAKVFADQHNKHVFEQQINECLDNVLIHFREEFPNHDENYYYFASYVFAGFDKELLMILTHTTSRDSVYSRKKDCDERSPYQMHPIRSSIYFF